MSDPKKRAWIENIPAALVRVAVLRHNDGHAACPALQIAEALEFLQHDDTSDEEAQILGAAAAVCRKKAEE